MTEASANGTGERIGDEESEGVGEGAKTFPAEGLGNACEGGVRNAIRPPRRLCKTQTETTARHTTTVTKASQGRTCLSCCPICVCLVVT